MPDLFRDRLEVASATDVGRKRTVNEDSLLVDSELGLLVVADGMGGHDAGDLASRMAVESVSDFLFEFDPDEMPAAALDFDPDATAACAATPTGIAEAGDAAGARAAVVRAAVETANSRIHEINRQRGYAEGAGIGTTIAGLQVLDGDQAVIFHAGDSRVYRLRDGALRQMTRDQTLYQEWLDRGAEGTAPKRNIVLNALGPWPSVDVPVCVESFRSGDLFVVCSDGLSSLVPDEDIRGMLSGSVDEICRNLVTAALEAGGSDNVTVIVARVR